MRFGTSPTGTNGESAFCPDLVSIAETERSAALEMYTVLLSGVNATQLATAEIGRCPGSLSDGAATSADEREVGELNKHTPR